MSNYRPAKLKQKHIGAWGEVRAVLWLLEAGYDVYRNVSPHGEVDIVAIRDGRVRKIDVKGVALGQKPPFPEGLQFSYDVEFLYALQDGQMTFSYDEAYLWARGEYPAYHAPHPCETCGATIPGGDKRRFCGQACRASKRGRSTPNMPSNRS